MELPSSRRRKYFVRRDLTMVLFSRAVTTLGQANFLSRQRLVLCRVGRPASKAAGIVGFGPNI